MASPKYPNNVLAHLRDGQRGVVVTSENTPYLNRKAGKFVPHFIYLIRIDRQYIVANETDILFTAPYADQ